DLVATRRVRRAPEAVGDALRGAADAVGPARAGAALRRGAAGLPIGDALRVLLADAALADAGAALRRIGAPRAYLAAVATADAPVADPRTALGGGDTGLAIEGAGPPVAASGAGRGPELAPAAARDEGEDGQQGGEDREQPSIRTARHG